MSAKSGTQCEEAGSHSEEEGEVWSVLNYAPVLPMDHGPLGPAGIAENIDAEPVEHVGVDAYEQEVDLSATDTRPILAKGTVH